MNDGAGNRRLIAVFAVTQTVGYGAMIQAFTVLLIPMSADLGLSRPTVAVAATVSVLVGAAAAVPVGRLLDRWGGRILMTSGSVLGVVSVWLWSRADRAPTLYAAFAGIGLALTMSTYEAAFAVLVVAVPTAGRDDAILAVTMIAGVATSLYYPLAGWLEAEVGWRSTVALLAAGLAVIAVPAHLWAVPGRAAHRDRVLRRTGSSVRTALGSGRFWLLALAFVGQSAAVSAFLLLMVSYLRDIGHPAGVASTLVVLVGVMQVSSRLVLRPLTRRFGMTAVAAVAFGVQAVGLLVLPLVGLSVWLAGVCIAAVGIGNGVGVVARPSIVATTFGVARFASILAVLTVPIALARAGAPLGSAWLGDWRFLIVAGTASLVSAAALVALTRRPLTAPATSAPTAVVPTSTSLVRPTHP